MYPSSPTRPSSQSPSSNIYASDMIVDHHQSQQTEQTEQDQQLQQQNAATRSSSKVNIPFYHYPSYWIDSILHRTFFFMGKCSATIPITILLLSIIITAILGSGIYFIQFETDPQKLWVPDKRWVLFCLFLFAAQLLLCCSVCCCSFELFVHLLFPLCLDSPC